MVTINHILGLCVLILITLFLRDLPYVNVVIINKMWIFYLVLLLFVGLSSIKFKVSIVTYSTFTLLFVSFLLTLLKLNFFAEGIGALIYFSMWIILFNKMITYFRDLKA